MEKYAEALGLKVYKNDPPKQRAGEGNAVVGNGCEGWIYQPHRPADRTVDPGKSRSINLEGTQYRHF